MKMNNVDKQYLDLLKNIIDNGVVKESRAGQTKGVFGSNMRFNLKEGFPLLTTKKVYTKGIIHELLWFLKGDTNIKYLVDNDTHIWDDDAYRYYLEKVKKNNSYSKWVEPISKEEFIEKVKQEEYSYELGYKYGDLSNVYGHQWRHWDVDYGSYVDQVKDVVDKLKTTPDDRRMIISSWNVADIPHMALPPCHVLCQFYTRELTLKERWELYYEKFKSEPVNEKLFFNPHLIYYGESQSLYYKNEYDYLLDEENIPTRELSCLLYQRSVDSPLGLPFNIASYALLTHMMAHVTNMSVGEFIFNGGDTHIYLNQMDGIKEQLSREPFDTLPTLWLNPNIDNIDNFTFDDIKIENYQSHPKIEFVLSTGL